MRGGRALLIEARVRFSSARRQLFFACVLTLVGANACRRELVGRPAPESDLYFPLGMVISQADQRLAYVMSTNWSQRFNTGWLSVVDLDAIVSGAATPADVIRQTLLVPSLSGELSASDDGALLAAAFRNNNQVIVFEVNADGSVQCGDPDAESGLDAGDRRTDCDARHVYRFVADGVDDVFIVDQFSDPYGVRFLPSRDGAQTLTIGYLTSFLGIGLVTFLDVDLGGEEILGNQRSIELGGASGLTVQTTGIVAPRPAPQAATPEDTDARFIAIGSRSSAAGVSSATIFGINIDDYEFKATEDTDFASVDFDNRAKIARIDIRAQAGGFTLADLVFTDDGSRAFAAVSFSQPTSGSSDSVLMLNARPRSRSIVLADDSIAVVQRPEYEVIDALAVPGTPQSVSYVPRLNAPPLLVTATFNDNALHFVRVGETSLDAITRIDRAVGSGPVVVRHARFTPSGQSADRDFVVITSFLSHGLTVFDVTEPDPSAWQQWRVESTLADGRRFR